MKKFWEIKNKGNKTGEIFIYSEISSSKYWGDETTPQAFKEDLDALGDIDTLNIYINSPGGDCFSGFAIYNMIKRHKAYKVVHIDGLAASAASFIAMAGDKIIMPKNAMMMIHCAWTYFAGNARDIIKIADELEKIDKSLVSMYAERTGLPDEQIMAMMEEETWMTADDAISKGFADELENEKKIAACMSSDFFNRYKNVPESIAKEDVEEPVMETEEVLPIQPIEDILTVYEQKIKLNNRRNDL